MEATTHFNVHAAGAMERDKWLTALSELGDRLVHRTLDTAALKSIVHIEEQARQRFGKAREAFKFSDVAKIIDYNNSNARVKAISASLMMRSMALRSWLQNAI